MKWKYSFWMTSGPVAGVVRTRGRLTRVVFGEILSWREGLHIYHRDKLTAEIFVSQRAFCRADIAAALSALICINYRFLFFLEFPLLAIFSVSISSRCLVNVSFIMQR